jgi:hypothetical protein
MRRVAAAIASLSVLLFVAGLGLVSVPAGASPRTTKPGSPVNVFAYSASTHTITVSWQYPTSDGGSPILYYVASATANGKNVCTTPSTFNTCSIGSLPGSRFYKVRVRAVNGRGRGPIATSTTYVMGGKGRTN